MTEPEWLAATDPGLSMYFLEGTSSERKLRLFTVACCRRIWHLLLDSRSRHAVETAERYADGAATVDELEEAREGASEAYQDGSDAFYRLRSDIPRPHSTAPHGAAIHVADGAPIWALTNSVRSAAYAVFHNVQPFTQDEADAAARLEQPGQMALLRCILGNPFRPVAFDPRWRSETAVALAAGIYDGRHFDRLPILADALEDAGCDVGELLNHLRGSGPHARGCWAVDAVLGKE